MNGAGHAGIVRRYYDQTTRLFMRFGGANAAYAIHRAVWTSPSESFESAINHTNRELLRCLRDQPGNQATRHPRIIDLGCGIGGSLFFLANEWPGSWSGLGVTISQTQAHVAQMRFKSASWPIADLAFCHGDYLHVPCVDQSFEAGYAIESYCHAPDPEAFFGEVKRLLKPGGRLIICDDFIETNRSGPAPAKDDDFWLRAYLECWRVPNLTSLQQTRQLAAGHGLFVIEQADLSAKLRLRVMPSAPTRMLIAAATTLMRSHEIVPSMIGSIALQQCLYRGLIKYRFLVFESQPDINQ